MPTFAETAAARISDLKRDPEFAGKYLAGGAGARNEMKTLLTLAHGIVDDATAATLADSIKLVRVPTAAAAERERQAAQEKADTATLKVNWGVSSSANPQELAAAKENMSGWVASMNLPPSTARTVLDRIGEQGPKIDAMDEAGRAAWLAEQRRVLLGAAGSEARLSEWVAGARKMLAGSKYANSYIAHDAWIVRHLAIAASARK
jgi:hypothetical protein